MKKKFLIFFISLIMTLSAGAGIAFALDSKDELPTVANVGETYDIPEYSHNSKRATVRVVAPDGSVTQSDKLNISTYGVYRVEYLVDGVVVKVHECVANMRPKDLFSTNSLVTNVSSGSYSYNPTSKKFSGVQFDIRSGAKIEYNNLIDVTNKTKDDILTQFIVKPEENGSRDFGRIILTFSDAEDPSSFFELVLSAGDLTGGNSPANSYLRGAGPNQKSGGWENGKFNTIDFYGSPVLFSFSGEDRGIAVHDHAMSIYYDHEENGVYAYWYGTKRLVVDFDDPAVHGSNVWAGFASGKAKMSVSFDKFVSNNGHIIFTQIDGVDLSTRTIKDIVAPEIKIDLQGEEKAPNSYLGATYPVFNATTKDFFDMDCDLNVAVFYNDSCDDKWYNVGIENGTFVTNKIGNYKIVYTAKDDANNVSVKEVSFVCLQEKNAISINGIATEKNCDVYDKLTLNDEIAVSGGNGNVALERKITAPSGKVVEAKNDVLIPEEIGDYVVEYFAVDFFGNGTKVQTVVHVSRIDGVKFIEEPKFPNVLISNFVYDIPPVKAIVCDGNEIKEVAVEAYVNGVKSNKDTFSVSQGNVDVTIEYKASDLQSKVYSLAPVVLHVVDAQLGNNKAAYFYDKDGKISCKENDSSVELSFNGNGGVQFANVLNRDSFEIDFVCNFNKLNFSTMKLRFVDSINENISQTIVVNVADGNLLLSTNNSKSIALETKISLNKYTFGVSFDNYTQTVKDISGTEISKFTIADDGKPFKGFEKGFNLFIEFEGVSGASVLEISKINNQYFGYVDADYPVGDETQPEIVYNGVYKTRMNLGDTIKVLSADVYDVLSQIDTQTVTVYSPSGKKVLSDAPINVDHDVVAQEIGNYKIVYNVTDTEGNDLKYRKQVVISVVDNVPPTLTVSTTYKETYKVGAVVSLPKYTITDNNDEALCDIMLQLPNGEVRLLSHYEDGKTTSFLAKTDDNYPSSFKASNTSFVLEKEGKYVLTVLAYDNFYNYVKTTFVFYVVK